MSFHTRLLPFSIVGCIAFTGLSPAAGNPSDHQPRNTVFWVSVDGFRPDYLDRAETPFFDRLIAEGAYSRESWPVFPSVTFSSHVSQATGATPEQHGIPGNSFYDNKTRSIHNYPGDADLLEAEPIWITASRQNIRTAVLDWPLAHNQQGPVTTAYSGDAFERGLSDEDRLTRLLDLWENDEHEQPLRLILGYTVSPDSQGHRHGPDSPEVTAAVERLDRLLARSFERARTIWKNQNPAPEDQLFLIISSDHGMSRVETLIHPGHLTGLADRRDLLIMTTGNVGHIHFNRVESETVRQTLIDQTLSRLSEFDFVQAFRRDEIPEKWGLRHPHRTGDVFLVLDNGYTFNRRADGIQQSTEAAGGPLGMHGYHPENNPEMLSPFFIFRAPDEIGGVDIGRVHSLEMHATVCQILGIDPAPEALKETIEWAPAAVSR